MKRRNRKRTARTLLVAALAGGVLSAMPASADCVSAEVSYERPGQSRQYVVGPKKCVASTPWNESLIIGDPEPAGLPSVILVGARAWVPLP